MSDAELFEDEAAVSEFKALMADPANRQAFVELKHRAAETGATKRYAHVLRAVSETPWAIRLPMLGIIVDLLAYRAAGGTLTHEEIEARIGAARRQSTASPSGVAVLPLHGVIMPKASMMSEMSGGTSIESFRSQFRQAVAASDVSGIVIDVDSPGGMVDGVPEMASEIRAARGSKPIVAVANTEAASAAYWLASQADQLFVTKSGRVGSIGVYTSHEDESARADQEGVKTTLISAGKYKTEGNPFEPLSEEAKANLQSMVDDYYGMFLADVARGRRVPLADIKSGYGEGRVVQASAALKGGMVDGIATLEDVVGGMLAQHAPKTAALGGPSPMVVTDDLAKLLGIDMPTVNNSNTTLDFSNESTATVVEGEPVEDEDGRLWKTFAVEDTEVVMAAPVDESAWDGNKAMTMCNSAADYESICAATHTIGQPGERQHYALPHHYLGRGPNADGTRQAKSRLSQTQNITDAERAKAQTHLDNHMKQISPASSLGEGVDLALNPDEELLAELANLREEL